ncbi:MAG: HesA/MoeB/ThiF family protein [Pseudomonadota bacterium]
MTRYARQIAVEGFGAGAQERFRNASVLVIGAGGLAAPVLQYLVGAGVGFIRLVDPDQVELSNLHRQTLFRESDIGAPKAVAAADHMKALNAEVRIEPHQTRFDPANAAALCADLDVIIDCADSFAASYIASDFCLTSGQPLISASIVGRDGYVGGFCGGAPGLRAVFPDLPDRLGSCAADGVLGPSVGVIGALQAEMALTLLSGSKAPLGHLTTYDATKIRFGGFSFSEAKDPIPKPDFIAASQIAQTDQVFDLRAENEAGPHLENATRFTLEDFATNPPALAPDKRTILACRSGLRAWQAADHLSKNWHEEIKLVALGP